MTIKLWTPLPASGEGQVDADYLETLFGYDLMGRRNRVISESGTIERKVFDARALLVSRWVGTDDRGATDANPEGTGGANNMRMTMAFVYDGGVAGGDGNVTRENSPVDDDPGNDRVTDFGYDYRNRRVTTTKTDGTLSWTTRVTYDNLNRPLQTTTFKASETDANRLAQSRTFYDALGRVYRAETDGIDPANGTVTATVFGQNWYDLGANVIKSAAAGQSAFTKAVFDALNRRTQEYLACVPGTAGVPAGDDNDLGDDTVMEQIETVYDRGGNVIMETRAQRFDDASGPGPLHGPLDEPKSRDTYAMTWPDAIGRPRVSADYGTHGGSVPTRPAVAPQRSDTILVTTNRYKDSGDANAVIDPMGIETRWENDKAGRRIRLEEGRLSSLPAANGLSSPLPSCTPTTSPPHSTPRITEFLWHPNGQLERLTLVNADTGDQITRWLFGTTLDDSAVASNNLLRTKIYPESDDRPAPAADGPDGVYARLEYTYNRQGQTLSFEDADQTVHEYTYDKLGRLTDDRVTAFGEGLDENVKRIGQSYDVRGFLWKSTSYSALTGGTVRNEVELGYDNFGNLSSDKQEHAGEVTGATPAVLYLHGSTALPLRRTQIVYPDGRTMVINYGASTGVDSLLNRVSFLKIPGDPGSQNLVEYKYVGLAWQVKITCPQPGVVCDYRKETGAPDGDAGDPYNGYDRFGRTADIRWQTSAATPVVLERLQYGFDRDSRRTWRRRTLTTDEDDHYNYDALSQVTNAARGSLNLNTTAISGRPANEQAWDYDPTGNWNGLRTAEDGGVVLDQHRVHDRGNRLTQIEGSANAVILDRAGRMRQSSPDAAGNWIGKLELVWDAWSRITSVKNNGTVVGTYAYDGLTRRIKRTVGGVIWHTYYSDQWRPLEERKDAETTASAQYLWGARHRDDLVRRDRAVGGSTLNETRYVLMDYFNPSAITDETGEVQERYAFSAFGERRILNPDFTPRSTSECAFEFAFQGQFIDTESGLMNYGFRYYSPHLGRWTCKDPIEEEGGTNVYAFVANDPPNLIDFLGLEVSGSYDISSGSLVLTDSDSGEKCECKGTSGTNDPKDASESDKGPVPPGSYDIYPRPDGYPKGTGLPAYILDPADSKKGNDIADTPGKPGNKRFGFRIHIEIPSEPRKGSDGCIVLTPEDLEKVKQFLDKTKKGSRKKITSPNPPSPRNLKGGAPDNFGRQPRLGTLNVTP